MLRSQSGTKRTSNCRLPMSAFGGKADIGWTCSKMRLGNKLRLVYALHRIPPGTDAAHPLVIAVDYLQRCMVRRRSWHQRGWRRIWRRWFTERFEQPLVPPKAAGGF